MPEIIKPGQLAPDFETVDDEGRPVKLSDYRGKKVVLYFYPRDETPGCTRQACGFRDNYPRIVESNAVVLGVSKDDISSHRQFKSKFELPFPLLVDTDKKIHEAYGTWGERERDGQKYMGVIRSHFLIGEDGTVIDVQYAVSPEDSVERSLQLI